MYKELKLAVKTVRIKFIRRFCFTGQLRAKLLQIIDILYIRVIKMRKYFCLHNIDRFIAMTTLIYFF